MYLSTRQMVSNRLAKTGLLRHHEYGHRHNERSKLLSTVEKVKAEGSLILLV